MCSLCCQNTAISTLLQESMFQKLPQKEIGFLWPKETYWDGKKAVDQG